MSIFDGNNYQMDLTFRFYFTPISWLQAERWTKFVQNKQNKIPVHATPPASLRALNNVM